jgi:hypothetical protein
LFTFTNETEADEHEAQMLVLRFLSEVQKVMELRGISRKKRLNLGVCAYFGQLRGRAITRIPVLLEGTGHFRAESSEEDAPDITWASLLNQSALGVVINSLRSAIVQLTAHGPFGKYVLPSVDVADLHRQKYAAMQAKAGPKRRRKKDS